MKFQKFGKLLDIPEKIRKKAPNDGLGGQTDEEKLGVTYKQIEEMIETGKTEENAQKIILQKFESSKHKRKNIPKYYFDRKNYLLEEDVKNG